MNSDSIEHRGTKPSSWWTLGGLKQDTRRKWNNGRYNLDARPIHRKKLTEYGGKKGWQK